MPDTDTKESSESEPAEETLVSNDGARLETSGELFELNLGADFELDEDDLAMLFALGLC